MKVICLREDLADAIGFTAAVASARTALPILQTIKMQAVEGKLKLLGCDGEMWAQREINAIIDEPGEVCVSAKFILDLISALPNGEMNLELKDHTLHIINATSRWNLLALSAEDFPDLPHVEHNAELRLSMGELKEIINSVTYAAADDISQPILSGVQFSYNGDRLTLVATDTFRLSIRHIDKAGIGSNVTAVVPVKALKAIKALPVTDLVEVSLRFDATRMLVDLGDAIIITQLLAGNYPNWESVIPSSTFGSWTFDRLEFLEHVKRTMILARDNANRIQFTGMDGQIQIRARSEEKGEAKEDIPAVCKNGDFEIAFNGRYLVDALSSLDCEGVRAEFTEPNRPALLKGVEKEDEHICVIMPMALGS